MTEVEQARSDVNRIGVMFEGEREGLVNDIVRLGTSSWIFRLNALSFISFLGGWFMVWYQL